MMNDSDQKTCKHKYIIGYSLRMPHAFFQSLPCDKCGCNIKLSLRWRILFLLTELLGFILAYDISTSVHIKIFGTTFIVSLVVFVLVITIAQSINRLIFRYGKWIEADKK